MILLRTLLSWKRRWLSVSDYNEKQINKQTNAIAVGVLSGCCAAQSTLDARLVHSSMQCL